MNPAPIDQLLQMTAARPEMFIATGRGRDATLSFDNHLANAALGTAPREASPTNSTSSPANNSPAQSPFTAPSISNPQIHNDTVAHEDAAATNSASTAADDAAPTKKTAEESDDGKQEESDETAEGAALLAASRAVENQVAGVQESTAAAESPSELQATSSQQESADSPKSTSQPPLNAAEDVTDREIAATDASQNSTEVAATSENAAHENQRLAAVAADQAVADPSAVSEQDQGETSSKSRQPETSAIADDNAVNGNLANEPAAKEAGTAATADVATGPASTKPAIIDRNESSNRNQKKSAARNDLSSREAAAAVERPANAPRTQQSVATPVVANVQSTQATKSAAASAAPAADVAAKDAKPGILSSLNRLDRAAAHSSRGAHRAGQSESASHVDPARFVSRVARAVQTAHERGGPLHLRLSPPELGAMRVELSVNQGTLSATIETDNQIAKQVLLDNLPALRDRLAEQNIRVERFDVDVRRDPSGQQQQQYHAPQDRQQSSRNQSAAAQRANSRHSAAVPGLNEPAPPRRTISNTSINVVA